MPANLTTKGVTGKCSKHAFTRLQTTFLGEFLKSGLGKCNENYCWCWRARGVSPKHARVLQVQPHKEHSFALLWRQPLRTPRPWRLCRPNRKSTPKSPSAPLWGQGRMCEKPHLVLGYTVPTMCETQKLNPQTTHTALMIALMSVLMSSPFYRQPRKVPRSKALQAYDFTSLLSKSSTGKWVSGKICTAWPCLPSTSGKSFSVPCEWNPRTGKVLKANSCLSVIRKASYFSFPRNIFVPVWGLTDNIRIRKIHRRGYCYICSMGEKKTESAVESIKLQTRNLMGRLCSLFPTSGGMWPPPEEHTNTHVSANASYAAPQGASSASGYLYVNLRKSELKEIRQSPVTLSADPWSHYGQNYYTV